MRTRNVGLIGFGSIGRSIIDAWPPALNQSQRLVSLLVRTRQIEHARVLASPALRVTDDFAKFVDGLDVAVEAAGHAAVLEHGEGILRRGVDCMLLSVGSLADESVLQRLKCAADAGRARILLPVGATAGLDGLLALRRAGLRHVRYTSTKPPAAWKDTVAQLHFDLDALTLPTVIFSGTARQAAALYPRNANLTAAVALAGLGFDDTEVNLVADPAARENVGQIEAKGATSSLIVTVVGCSAPDNPKTSRITGMSVLSALDNQDSLLGFV